MLDDFGTSKVTVKKDELLEAIRKNREAHHEAFMKAQTGYRVAVIEHLEKMLKDAREGASIKTVIDLETPCNYTKDYDRVIRMLEMSQADTITITEKQFSQYVLDEWGWSHVFERHIATYTGK
jgi:hypothetical protein